VVTILFFLVIALLLGAGLWYAFHETPALPQPTVGDYLISLYTRDQLTTVELEAAVARFCEVLDEPQGSIRHLKAMVEDGRSRVFVKNVISSDVGEMLPGVTRWLPPGVLPPEMPRKRVLIRPDGWWRPR
jgi:hypothetical protein